VSEYPYRCGLCGACDCKLYRKSAVFLVDDMLRCVACVHDEVGRDLLPSSVPLEEGGSLGWYVPAVPDGHGSFWGFSSVPQDDATQWYLLPNAPGEVPPTDVPEAVQKVRVEHAQMQADLAARGNSS
jgi:hypothetical protein